MAKVTTPLLSFGARGAIADTLVYFPWKGIDCVRSYVIPSNPNTAAQQTQRGHFGDAIDGWHDDGLDADDVSAWNRYASSLTKSMSGFNAFVRDHVDLAVAGETPDMPVNGALVDDADNTFSGSCDESGTWDAADMIWGTSPTALNNTSAGAETTNTWDFTPADSLSGVRIFARFVGKLSGNVVGRSGVFVVDIA